MCSQKATFQYFCTERTQNGCNIVMNIYHLQLKQSSNAGVLL